MTILLVEQNVRQALAIADRGYVLESGRIILDGEAAALAEHELLVSAYLGLQTRRVSDAFIDSSCGAFGGADGGRPRPGGRARGGGRELHAGGGEG